MESTIEKGSKQNVKNITNKMKKVFNSDLRFRPLMNPANGNVLSDSHVQALNNAMFLLLCLLVFNFIQFNAFADSLTSASDIFNMEMFVGNTKWFEKWTFVGQIVQWGISVGGFVAAVIVAVQVGLTVLYFGMPSLWDTVNERKKAETGLLNYTAKTFFGGNIKSTASKGSDIIMDYLLLLCPDVKKYSENADDEYDSITTWFMGTFLKKCITLLAVSMMMNGSFMKLYMVMVDGIGVVAERYVEYDSKAAVNRLLKTGSNYEFGYGSSGKGLDSLQGDICTKLYKEFIKTSDANDTDSKYTLGSAIEKYVKSQFGKEDQVRSKLMNISQDYNMTDADWERVTVKVVANGSKDSTNGTTLSIDDLGIKDAGVVDKDKKRYFHIYLQAGKAVDTTQYFTIPGSPEQ